MSHKETFQNAASFASAEFMALSSRFSDIREELYDLHRIIDDILETIQASIENPVLDEYADDMDELKETLDNATRLADKGKEMLARLAESIS